MSRAYFSDLRLLLRHLGAVRAMVLVGPNLGGYEPSEEKKRRVAAIMGTARERGVDAEVEALMEEPFYPPSMEKTAARERVRRLARENLPRMLSASNLKGSSSEPAIRALARGSSRRPWYWSESATIRTTSLLPLFSKRGCPVPRSGWCPEPRIW